MKLPFPYKIRTLHLEINRIYTVLECLKTSLKSINKTKCDVRLSVYRRQRLMKYRNLAEVHKEV